MTDHSVPADTGPHGLPQPPVPDSAAVVARDRPLPSRAGAFAPSFFRAVLCGIGGAVGGAAAWYALVVFTDRQFVFGAIGLGFAVGYLVSWGAAKGGVTSALLSAIIAALGVVGAYYYINRHLLIAEGERLGSSYEIPLIPTFEELRIVLRVGYEADDRQYVFSGICVAAAAFFGFKGIRASRGYTGRPVTPPGRPVR